MGKTTVAVAVAHALLADFGGDVCFVDLASLTDARQVPPCVASALGLTVSSSDAISSLLAFVHDRRTLLVLDGCEHVVDTVAPLAERVVRDAPGVHILTPSRESPRPEAESVHRIPPLPCPPPGNATPPPTPP